MRLDELLAHVDHVSVHGTTAVDVVSVTRDSREAGPGVVWVAVRGAKVDGHDFIEQIVDGVVIAERGSPPPGTVWVRVDDSRLALAQAAAALAGAPARAVKVVGITGTNGKTTITTLCAEAMAMLDRSAGRIGTLGAAWGEQSRSTGFTTPEAPVLQGLLAEMRRDGVEAAFVEVTSIALAQRRAEALPFFAVVFTNLTRDHLDHHGDMAAYAAAKALLFEESRMRRPNGLPRALLCGDDPSWEQMGAPADRWTYGFGEGNDLRIVDAELTAGGQRLTLEVPEGGAVTLESPMIGRFNALNLAAALGCLRLVGVPWSVAARGLGKVRTVPGRLEPVPNDAGLTVVVDYAHTPDALEAALRSMRGVAEGRLWVVFGCGGDRDAGKRPMMGEVATRLADEVVLTSDNPRTEDPRQIVDDILRGVDGPVRVELDRREAIGLALGEAVAGDVVVIAGKGHEATQEIHGVKRPFDDRRVARAALDGR